MAVTQPYLSVATQDLGPGDSISSTFSREAECGITYMSMQSVCSLKAEAICFIFQFQVVPLRGRSIGLPLFPTISVN